MVDAAQRKREIEREKWQWERARFKKRMRMVAFYVVGFTAFSFLLMFTMGALVGLADPAGWGAWRVGLMAGGISAMGVFAMGLVGAAIYLAE